MKYLLALFLISPAYAAETFCEQEMNGEIYCYTVQSFEEERAAKRTQEIMEEQLRILKEAERDRKLQLALDLLKD